MGDLRANKARPIGTCMDPDSVTKHLSDLSMDGNDLEENTIRRFSGGRERDNGNVRRSGDICNKCNSEIIVDKEGEDAEKDLVNYTWDSEAGFSNDQAKCVKVILKCQCCKRLSFLRRYKGTDVLDKSCIILRYTSRTQNEKKLMIARRQARGAGSMAGVPEDPQCDHKVVTRDKADGTRAVVRNKAGRQTLSVMEYIRTSSLKEDTSKYHLGNITLFITNPDKPAGDNKVRLGMTAAVIKDEKETVRYYVIEVSDYSPAYTMEIKPEDEILLVDNQLVVGAEQRTFISMFADIKPDVEFSLLIRRITNRRSVLDIYCPDDIQYIYWTIRATITVDSFEAPVVKENLMIRKEYKDGQLIFVGDPEDHPPLAKVIKCEHGYLQRKPDGSLGLCQSPSKAEANSFYFDILSYDARRWRHNSRPTQMFVWMIRHLRDGKAGFLSVTNQEVIVKETASEDHIRPSLVTLNDQNESPDFDFSSTIFVPSVVNNGGRGTYRLMCYSAMGHSSCDLAAHPAHYLSCESGRLSAQVVGGKLENHSHIEWEMCNVADIEEDHNVST